MCPLTRFAITPILTLMMTTIVAAQGEADEKVLQGKWAVTRMVKRGELMAPEDIARMSLEFSKDSLTLGNRGDKRTFTFKTDAKKKPKEIDLTAENGAFKGQTIPGIYQLDGATLVLCLPHDDNTVRPDAFEALGGVAPSRILLTLKRVKD